MKTRYDQIEKAPSLNFECAKLLHEIGYRNTSDFMGYTTKFYHPKTKTLLAYGRTGKLKLSELYYAPKEDDVVRWLRNTYKIHINISLENPLFWIDNHEYEDKVYYKPSIFRVEEYFDYSTDIFTEKLFNTYEEALSEGLQKVLEKIKQQQNEN